MALVFNKIMAKVSVIIPIYNVEEYLERCLDSVIAQTFSDIEIILVDDGSTDKSGIIAKQYADKDARIILLNQNNKGGSGARNTGLKHATSEYIMFLDSDDYFEINCIETAYKKIKDDHSDVAIFGSSHKQGDKIIKKVIPESDICLLMEDHKELIEKIENCTWDKIYKKSLFIENDILYPDDLYYEDMATTMILFAHVNKVSFIPESLITYTVGRQGNQTHEVSDRVLDLFKIINTFEEHYKQLGKYETFEKELNTIGVINVLDKFKMVISFADEELLKEYSSKAIDYIFNKRKNSINLKKILNIDSNNFIYLNKLTLKLYIYIKRGVLL